MKKLKTRLTAMLMAVLLATAGFSQNIAFAAGADAAVIVEDSVEVSSDESPEAVSENGDENLAEDHAEWEEEAESSPSNTEDGSFGGADAGLDDSDDVVSGTPAQEGGDPLDAAMVLLEDGSGNDADEESASSQGDILEDYGEGSSQDDSSQAGSAQGDPDQYGGTQAETEEGDAVYDIEESEEKEAASSGENGVPATLSAEDLQNAADIFVDDTKEVVVDTFV